MERTAVESTNIASVGYDEQSQTLEIEFQHGGIYQYFDVPQTVHEQLMSADSKGAFLAQNLKGYYRFVRV